MATANSKNARLLIATTGAPPYTIVTKTHGLKLSLPADWADASSHGDTFKSANKGLMDWSATVMQWYDSVQWLLDGASVNGTSYYFLAYFNYPTDTLNYWRGQCTFGLNEHNLDLGTSIDASYEARIYNGDVQLVRGGTAFG